MGILRADRVAGLGGANAINGSVNFGSSLLYSGRSNLTVTPNSELDIGAGNFTIEYWFNCENTSSGEYSTSVATSEYNGSSSNTAFTIYHYVQGFRIFNRISGGYTSIFNTSSSWTASKWHHFAWVREGTGSNENKIYVDGTLSGSAFTNAANYTAGQHWLIGSNFNGGFGSPEYGFSGYLSNVRVSNTARYTANFTVPTTRLEKDTNTILLACQSPGNILKEETGKIITVYNSNINNSPPQASHFAPDVGEDHGTTFEDNTKFDTLSYMVPPGGTTAESNRGRAVFAGGYDAQPGRGQWMKYLSIQSGGLTTDFGDMLVAMDSNAGTGNATRGLIIGGDTAPTNLTDTIQYITFATTSNATDFGNTSSARRLVAALANNTRAVYGGGTAAPVGSDLNEIEYITIATTGNATDFGDLTQTLDATSALSSPTRGVFIQGMNPASARLNVMEYITIASTGNATDFGDTTAVGKRPSTGSNSTRGVYAGGDTAAGDTNETNVIGYITIASTGNATDFGDLVLAVTSPANGQACSPTRMLVSGGNAPGTTYNNIIQMITIETTGNAVDWGDLTEKTVFSGAAMSDSHGGIS